MKKVSGHKPGGGIASNKRVEKPIQRGVNARKISEKGVSQIGQGIGNHVTSKGKLVKGGVEPVRGGLKPDGKPGGIPLGQTVALNASGSKAGPGAGRSVQPCGTQGCYGEKGSY